jgi:hypothetical protein
VSEPYVWFRWFAWRPVRTTKLHIDGYFYDDRVAWRETVWRRINVWGDTQYALTHPITGEKP